MFEAKDFLDLKQFAFPELFEGDGEVWMALKGLHEFIKKHLKPAQLGTILGTPYIADDVFVGKGTVIEHGATIKGPAIIGENCQIRSSAYIRGDVERLRAGERVRIQERGAVQQCTGTAF